MERLSDFRWNEAEDRWEVLRVWKGCRDDDPSSVFVPVNELLDILLSLTRKWLRRLFKVRLCFCAGCPSSIGAEQ